MAWGPGKGRKSTKKGGHGGDHLASSSRSQKVGTRAEYEAALAEFQFKDKVSNKAKEVFEEVEATVVVKREQF
jgi:hypothetical protein